MRRPISSHLGLGGFSMKKLRLLGAMCAYVFTLLPASVNAALTTANTANCVGYDDCDDAAFLTAVAAEGGNVPLDVVLDFTQDKLGNALSGFAERPGDTFSDAVTFSTEPGTIVVASSPDVNSFVGVDGSGNSIHLVGPANNVWEGILSIDFSSPVSAVGFGTVDSDEIYSISIFDPDDVLIGSFPRVSSATFNYFGVVATAGEQISRIEVDGDNMSIQDIQFNYMQGDIPGVHAIIPIINFLLAQFVPEIGSTPTAAKLRAGHAHGAASAYSGSEEIVFTVYV
jgi:hypothetical protein